MNHVLAQSNAFEPSLIYHIQDNLELQKLPSPQWILQEGESDLTVEDLLKGEYKDASFLHLSSTPVFKMKVHHTYWLNLQLSAGVKVDEAGLVFQ